MLFLAQVVESALTEVKISKMKLKQSCPVAVETRQNDKNQSSELK